MWSLSGHVFECTYSYVSRTLLQLSADRMQRSRPMSQRSPNQCVQQLSNLIHCTCRRTKARTRDVHLIGPASWSDGTGPDAKRIQTLLMDSEQSANVRDHQVDALLACILISSKVLSTLVTQRDRAPSRGAGTAGNTCRRLIWQFKRRCGCSTQPELAGFLHT